jgi:hypothetical protein
MQLALQSLGKRPAEPRTPAIAKHRQAQVKSIGITVDNELSPLIS